MIGVLIRRGNLDTQRDTRDAHTQRKDHVRTQQEGSLLQAKERGLSKNQACPHLDLRLSASRTEKINFSCVSHSVCGILLWQS